MSVCVQYPSAGCIVEYLEGNAIQIALVTEESGGKLRLLLPNRRETRLTTSRLLPWAGPALGSVPGKDESARVLEQHRARREELAAALPVLELWEMSQGEVPEASAQWFAELAGQAGDADSVAACGRALLACKSHFRFQPPVFQIFSAEMVEKRLKEQQERAAREALVLGGNSFFRLLWDVACKKRALPPQPGEDTRGISEWPAPEVAERLKQILFARMADPESQEYDELWRMLSKGLPDVPHLPVQLLMAWEQVPAHYNFWYDRAGYAPGDDWWQPLAPAVEALQRAAREVELPVCDLPFISIDSATTRDVDDAFHILPTDDGGFDLTLALACPAACWPFSEALDKAVFRRGTSIYLPEGDSHMMPEALGTDAFSLLGDAAAAEASFDSYAAAVDALYSALAERLAERGQMDLLHEIEMPLCAVLAEMETAGCRVDAKALGAFGDLLARRSAELEQQIYAMAGEEFNINSPKQLGEILFGKLGLPHGKKTKTGWSTNADVLDKLRYEPIVRHVLEYRELTKLKSTYADGLLKVIGADGRIHTNFQMTVTATGRLSSTEPNLQNIPIRMEMGREFRKVFKAKDGFVFLDADYSQIELRVLADMSEDEHLIQAYKNGDDIHRSTASKVFHTPFDEVTDLQRRNAKAVNFGIVYGISAFGLSQDLGTTRKEADEIIKKYFATYPAIKAFLDEKVEEAKETGYSYTKFGRRRPVPEIKSSNFMQRSFGERIAMNSPIQGTAADIIKIAMIKVARKLKEEKLNSGAR